MQYVDFGDLGHHLALVTATAEKTRDLAEGAPLAAVAGHLGDTIETVSGTYVC